ncbi:uncharacterized protein LACBIDRAFT_297124 [Laccaria bicolor S238N-H82]|uniref:Predicted protein n=1 Tax=Laccaria bicolor (strain S238N-H82 / ATCC MYA-4686) TaxID=486041 RepID=B0DA22_LACBS|nr:uncharacterized protein LACBIDRAFT_297124 [Laccaria bicolor S238N-H82]EDR08448.1 predicted protein [Laccaria bicolor S238N-H82]|eukprot:XP_001880673.1 predicted protein [Laccaria bicolor S238N-H82]
MCELEVFGDYYRGCGHFIRSYYSGEKFDCNSQTCGISSAHIHKAPNCRCNKTPYDHQRVVNMFHTPCDECRSFDRLPR